MLTSTKNIEIWLLLSVLALVLPANQRVRGFQSDTPSFSDSVSHDEAQGESFPKCAKPEDTICLNSQCVHTADMVLSKMKQEVEPCNNFYEFACGKVIEEPQIPDDKDIVNIFSTIKHTLQEQLKIILREERLETDPSHLKLPNALYKACMNTTLIESLGAKPMEEIADHLGGWPVVVGDSWDINNTWSWQEAVQKFKLLGFNSHLLFRYTIYSTHPDDDQKYILSLNEPELALDREYLIKGFNESRVSAYYDYMVDIAVLFGAEREAARNELKGAVQFEMDLAKITMSKEESVNLTALYNVRTFKELQEDYSYVQWLEFFKQLFTDGPIFYENMLMNVENLKFFKNFGALLLKTDKRDVANYMMWRIHSSAVRHLSKVFRKRQLQYYTTSTGVNKKLSRSEDCLRTVESSFLSISMENLYAQKHFPITLRISVLELVNNVQDAFEEVLNETIWMDDLTREEAKRKLRNMKTYIGYPEELLDNSKLEKLYDGLEIYPEKYFRSIMNLRRHKASYNFNKFRMPKNETLWVEYAKPTLVNAYYQVNDNIINFPAGFLHEYIFNAERRKYMNYGALGYIIGHEITHAFDSIGRQHDQNGYFANWWQPETEKAFLKKAQCIIEQYGNFTDRQTGLQINGNKTLAENIADIGGVKAPYLAYSNWLAKNGAELKLPGLQNYTSKQMFWISVAQVLCTASKTEKVKDAIVDTPNELRVLGAFANSEDFSRDFQCSKGTPMNPEKKCVLW